jgi:hypothetical protein
MFRWFFNQINTSFALLISNECARICRVGQSRYSFTVCDRIIGELLAQNIGVHRIYMVSANPTHAPLWTGKS